MECMNSLNVLEDAGGMLRGVKIFPVAKLFLSQEHWILLSALHLSPVMQVGGMFIPCVTGLRGILPPRCGLIQEA